MAPKPVLAVVEQILIAQRFLQNPTSFFADWFRVRDDDLLKVPLKQAPRRTRKRPRICDHHPKEDADANQLRQPHNVPDKEPPPPGGLG